MVTKKEIKEVEVTGRASVWLRGVSGADTSRGETQRVEEANIPVGYRTQRQREDRG